MAGKGRGWHGDPAGHAKAGRKGGKSSSEARRKRKQEDNSSENRKSR